MTEPATEAGETVADLSGVGQVDQTTATYIVMLGKKGSGKSILAERYFLTWEGDRLVLDPTSTITRTRPAVAEQTTAIEDPYPSGLPGAVRLDDLDGGQPPAAGQPRRDRLSLRYVPSGGPDEMVRQMDHLVGLCFARGNMLIWIDEMADLARVHRTPPHTHQVLYQGRHQHLSTLWCGPRPAGVDPLVLAQADLVCVFELPRPQDRELLAAQIGAEPGIFDAAIEGLGRYEWIQFDARQPRGSPLRLAHMSPLPAESLEYSESAGGQGSIRPG